MPRDAQGRNDANPILSLVPEEAADFSVFEELGSDETAEEFHVRRQCPSGLGMVVALCELDRMAEAKPDNPEIGYRIAYGERVLRLLCDAVVEAADGCGQSYMTSRSCPLIGAVTAGLGVLDEPAKTINQISQLYEPLGTTSSLPPVGTQELDPPTGQYL
ncbi:MAG TPA: hypothetical protein VK674_02805 [Candidatus Limnocylindria bacterium]|nr:hypothetical protein [Candidatus Limnocylindria bacterium]